MVRCKTLVGKLTPMVICLLSVSSPSWPSSVLSGLALCFTVLPFAQKSLHLVHAELAFPLYFVTVSPMHQVHHIVHETFFSTINIFFLAHDSQKGCIRLVIINEDFPLLF